MTHDDPPSYYAPEPDYIAEEKLAKEKRDAEVGKGRAAPSDAELLKLIENRNPKTGAVVSVNYAADLARSGAARREV